MAETWPFTVHDARLSFLDSSSTAAQFQRTQLPSNVGILTLLTMSYCVLLTDSLLDPNKPKKVIRKFYNELLSDPIKVIGHLGDLCDLLLSTVGTYASQKEDHECTITGTFLHEFKDTPIFREYLEFYRTGDETVLQYILTFLRFGKKVEFEDPDFFSRALRQWEEIEDGLENLVIDDVHVEALRTIVTFLVPSLDDALLLPTHGSGFVSEGVIDPHDKNDHLAWDSKLAFAFKRRPFWTQQMDTWPRLDFPDVGKDTGHTAKLTFVPKDIKKARTICMEPATRMYFQQEVMRWMVHAFRAGPMGNISVLHDQSVNQRFALESSHSQSADTIDLSSASDSVQWNLVKAVFPAKYVYYFTATRSGEVRLPDGSVRKLQKFAPMGSALCFPVQCVIFAAISLLGYALTDNNTRHVKDLVDNEILNHDYLAKLLGSMHSSPQRFSLKRFIEPKVYGDDIIVDRRVSDDVLNLLHVYGFTPNEEKSFVGGTPIRESCGIYAFDGHDVTPFLFRIPSIPSRKMDSRIFASWIEAINRAGDYKYSRVRGFWINSIRKMNVGGLSIANISEYLPFVSDRDHFGIYTTNKHVGAYLRYNRTLMRDEEKILSIVPYKGNARSNSAHDSLYRYMQWMRARIFGGSYEFDYSSSKIRPQTSRIRPRWTPV